jgi:hypothetical protein
MKYLLVLFLVLGWFDVALAQDTQFWMLIIDPDPQGTNIRESPGGKVKRIIAPGRTDEEKHLRQIFVTGQQDKWFSVQLLDGTTGWLHQSVLGTCAAVTKDRSCSLYQKPEYASGQLDLLEMDVPLLLLEVHGEWAKVRTATNPVQEGWLPEECFFSNPWSNCHESK